ncbi:MAG: transglutaminaseTgpA domain-containing protein [Thermoanaerobaculia bacterium]
MTRDPEAPLPFLRERLLSVGTLAALAPIPLFFAYTLEVGLLAVYLLALGVILYRAHRGRIFRLSNAVLNVAALVYLPVYWADIRYGSHSLLRATLHLLLFTMIFRLTSLRRERDLSMALALSGFLFVASVSTSYHFSILLFVAGFGVVGWRVLVRWSLFRDLASVPEEWSRDPRASLLPGWCSVGASVATALVLAVPFFLLLPRLRAPYVRGVASGQEITTGISETADPDLFGTLKRSDRVLARLTSPGSGETWTEGLLRLRVVAYERWDGRTWRNPGSRGRLLPAAGGALVPLGGPRAPVPDESHSFEIDLLPSDSRYIPFPIRGTALRFEEFSFQGWLSAQLERDEARNLRLFYRPERTLRYTAFVGDAPEPDRSPGRSAETLAAPRSDALGRIARDRTAGIDPERDPEAAAAALEGWLRSDFSYALEGLPSGPDGVERFLSEKKSGHCQSFATAMALLLRELDIPSRFVAGFAGGEIGPFGRYVLIRGEHAHAWVEAWCGPKGWIAFDPTPAAGVPGVTRVPLLSRLRQLADGVEFLYDRFLLGYTQGDQIELLRAARETAGMIAAAARDTFARLRGAFGAAGASMGRAGRAAVALGLVAAAALLFARVVRRAAGLPRRLPPAAAAYRKLQQILRRYGARLPASSAPVETLSETKRVAPRGYAIAREVVEAYLRESFSPGTWKSEDEGALRDRLRAMRAALRSSASA